MLVVCSHCSADSGWFRVAAFFGTGYACCHERVAMGLARIEIAWVDSSSGDCAMRGEFSRERAETRFVPYTTIPGGKA